MKSKHSEPPHRHIGLVELGRRHLSTTTQEKLRAQLNLKESDPIASDFMQKAAKAVEFCRHVHQSEVQADTDQQMHKALKNLRKKAQDFCKSAEALSSEAHGMLNIAMQCSAHPDHYNTAIDFSTDNEQDANTSAADTNPSIHHSMSSLKDTVLSASAVISAINLIPTQKAGRRTHNAPRFLASHLAALFRDVLQLPITSHKGGDFERVFGICYSEVMDEPDNPNRDFRNFVRIAIDSIKSPK